MMRAGRICIYTELVNASSPGWGTGGWYPLPISWIGTGPGDPPTTQERGSYPQEHVRGGYPPSPHFSGAVENYLSVESSTRTIMIVHAGKGGWVPLRAMEGWVGGPPLRILKWGEGGACY
jgi:hypothetical protein